MNTAIIVAAGAGKRFGGEAPKQFLTLRGKTLLEITLSRFEHCTDVDEIVLVVPEERLRAEESLQSQFTKLKSIVAGGSTRAESVRNGLEEVRSEGVVAVHDGARPLVSVSEISLTIAAAKKHGASCLVVPVTDTIKKTDGRVITGTLDRSKMRRAVTPQCFEYGLLKRAFAEADSIETATDECSLVERLGVAIRIVEGSVRNIKITMPEDLKIAEALLDQKDILAKGKN